MLHILINVYCNNKYDARGSWMGNKHDASIYVFVTAECVGLFLMRFSLMFICFWLV